MKKILIISLIILMLSGCMPSPVVVTINGEKLDASEFAFYMNYQLLSYDDIADISSEEIAKIKEKAIEQMITNTVIVQKCNEYGLKISDEDKANIKDLKKEFIDTLGGSAKYLEFLKESAMNDRMYDKTQKHTYYQNMIMTYLVENTDLDESIGFTDEKLRQYFSQNYIKLKYIFISAVNDTGEVLTEGEYHNMQEFARVVAEGSREEGKDFDQLIEKYNSDSQMALSPDGFVYTKSELEESNIFNNALELEENQIGGPYNTVEGFYIIKRIPVDAGYFDVHQDQILNDAIDTRYEETLSKWIDSSVIKISDVYNKMDQNNYKSYIK